LKNYLIASQIPTTPYNRFAKNPAYNEIRNKALNLLSRLPDYPILIDDV